MGWKAASGWCTMYDYGVRAAIDLGDSIDWARGAGSGSEIGVGVGTRSEELDH